MRAGDLAIGSRRTDDKVFNPLVLVEYLNLMHMEVLRSDSGGKTMPTTSMSVHSSLLANDCLIVLSFSFSLSNINMVIKHSRNTVTYEYLTLVTGLFKRVEERQS